MSAKDDPSLTAERLTELRKAKNFRAALKIVDELPPELPWRFGKLASAVAQVMYEGGRPEYALEFLKMAIASEELKDDVRLRNLYTNILIKERRPDEAFALVKETLAIWPDNCSAGNILATIHIGRKQYGIAEPILLHNIAADPKDRFAPQLLAGLYADTGKWGAAKKILKGLLLKEPENTRTAAFLAACHVEAGEFREAEHVLHDICNSESAKFDMTMLHTVTILARNGFATRLHTAVIETAQRYRLVRPEVLEGFKIESYPKPQPEKVTREEIAREIRETLRLAKSRVTSNDGKWQGLNKISGLGISYRNTDRTMRM